MGPVPLGRVGRLGGFRLSGRRVVLESLHEALFVSGERPAQGLEDGPGEAQLLPVARPRAEMKQAAAQRALPHAVGQVQLLHAPDVEAQLTILQRLAGEIELPEPQTSSIGVRAFRDERDPQAVAGQCGRATSTFPCTVWCFVAPHWHLARPMRRILAR